MRSEKIQIIYYGSANNGDRSESINQKTESKVESNSRDMCVCVLARAGESGGEVRQEREGNRRGERRRGAHQGVYKQGVRERDLEIQAGTSSASACLKTLSSLTC